MKLYGRRSSSNVQKVLWAFQECGVEPELEEVGGPFGRTTEDWYLALNPTALVPTLVDDGLAIWESNAILRHLCRSRPECRLMPQDLAGQAQVDQWLDWSISLQNNMKPVFLGLVRTPAEKRNEQAIAAAVQVLQQQWAIIDRHLEENAFMAGSEFTIADIPVAIQAYRWTVLTPHIGETPNVAAWHDMISGRPGFAAHVAGPLT